MSPDAAVFAETTQRMPETARAAAVFEIRQAVREGRVETISFDVFDTCLFRRCTDPVGVFERAFQLLDLADASAARMEMFVQHRQIAEGAARKEAQLLRKTMEVGIAEIYARFPSRLFGLDGPEPLIAAEFAAERDLCCINPEIVDVLTWVREAGVRAGFISDIYWTADQVAELLHGCSPTLAWDFLLVSSEHGTGKKGNLFAEYLRGARVDATRAIHIGDNPGSDVQSAGRFGIRALHYPQADKPLAEILRREDAVGRLISGQGQAAWRLDRGTRTLRRDVLGRLPLDEPAFAYGARAIGEVVAAFDDFVASRVAEIEARGGRVGVAFLARDGHLPMRVWQARGRGDAAFVHVNRRTAMLAAADDPEVVAKFFRRIRKVNLAAVRSFFRFDTPRLRKYFRSHGVVSGTRFAEDVPGLLFRQDLVTFARETRARLLKHLHREIPDFDGLTDLVLVDLGYSGTVQKALRRALDLAGLPHRLHGVYVVTVDEDLEGIAAPDTAVGMISGTVMLPAVRHGVLSNIALFEQICSTDTGSVAEYDAAGNVVREDECRPAPQHRLCEAIRMGAVAYAAAKPPQQCADIWAAATLARTLLLPTDAELELLSTLRHDVNLGTDQLAPLTSVETARAMLAAQPLPAALGHRIPPMWMAGSHASVSPLHGALFALHALGALPTETLGEAPVATVTVVICYTDTNHSYPVSVPAVRGAFGELRIRVPLRGGGGPIAVAFPAKILPASGTVQGITFAHADSVADAMDEPVDARLPVSALKAVGMTLAGTVFTSGNDGGFLAVDVPEFSSSIGVVTIAVMPSGDLRLLAGSDL